MGEVPVVAGSTIGVVANPMSGRDIRRLVARASVFPNAEKASMVLRLAAAAGTLGVQRVLVSTDEVGVAASVLRAYRRERASTATRWPDVEFVELPEYSATAADTAEHVRRMRAAGADVIVVLGGDGTARAAAGRLGDTPMLPLSTGTNNAFGQVWEATVAGAAAALVATGRLPVEEVGRRAKLLRVRCGSVDEIALVDACVCTTRHVGARALWHVDDLREVYCAFGEPHAIGLSSVAGQLLPTPRDGDRGVVVRLDPHAAGRTVFAPIAPGVLRELGVGEVRPLALGELVVSDVTAGTVALDGERELEFRAPTRVSVRLTGDGPVVIDVQRAMWLAAQRQLFAGAAVVAEQ